MEDGKKILSALLEEGEHFTYENFSTKSEHGYPEAYEPSWEFWTTRVRVHLRRLFGSDSAPFEMIYEADRVPILGYGPDKFRLAKLYFIGALQAAISILEDDTFAKLRQGSSSPREHSKRIFVVHGHDTAAKTELEAFLRELRLEPVVLHRQPDEGKTVIEKFERHSDVGYAFILLTPDEIAYLAAQEALPDDKRVKERRARPNVIFEFGYFVGRLGRSRVCCLYTGDVTIPSDLDGLVYKSYKEKIEEVAYSIIRELRAAGYKMALGPTQ